LEKEVKHLISNAPTTQQEKEKLENCKMDRVLSVSCYLALCSLYDQLQKEEKDHTIHPSILTSSAQAFQSEKKAIHYVSELYHTISQALLLLKTRRLSDTEKLKSSLTHTSEQKLYMDSRKIDDQHEGIDHLGLQIDHLGLQIDHLGPQIDHLGLQIDQLGLQLEQSNNEEKNEVPDEIEFISSMKEDTAKAQELLKKKRQKETQCCKHEEKNDERIIIQTAENKRDLANQNTMEKKEKIDTNSSSMMKKKTPKKQNVIEIEENFKNDVEFQEIYRNISQKIQEDAFSGKEKKKKNNPKRLTDCN
jgi:hypothetical protein